MNIKSILAVAAVAVGSSIFFGKNKYDQYSQVLNNLQFKLKNLKNISFNGGKVVFDVDIELINPTPVAIDIPGEKLVVKKLHFYTNTGKPLGIALPNLSNIEMPANGSRTITNIPVKLSLAEIGNSFSEILNIVLDPKQLKISADLQAFGKSFSVNA